MRADARNPLARCWVYILSQSLLAGVSVMLCFHSYFLPRFHLDREPLLTVYKSATAVLIASALTFPLLVAREFWRVRGELLGKVLLLVMSVALSLYQLFALVQPIA
jgi:hypothetical protein